MFKYTDEELKAKEEEKRDFINNEAIKAIVRIKGIFNDNNKEK